MLRNIKLKNLRRQYFELVIKKSTKIMPKRRESKRKPSHLLADWEVTT